MKKTKKALVMSALSLLACVSMLIGTTFAWFTDSVTSANNIIKSGNLDIELEYWNGTEWLDVEGASDILTNTLWEPGVVEVAYLRVANAGSLALKYQLGVNIVEEIAGKNAAGEKFLLSDYIQFGVVEMETFAVYADRDAAVAAVKNNSKKISAGYTKAHYMTAGQELYLALVVGMPPYVGNEANHNGTDIPKIDLGINIYATQSAHVEEDSFGADYDMGSPWASYVDIEWYTRAGANATEYVLTSGEQLAGLAAIVNGTAVAPTTTYAAREVATIKDNFKGKTIKLGGNIDLRNQPWTPIGDNANPFLGNFDGQGYTVSNLFVSNEGWAGLIGHAGKAAGCIVKNVTIDGATILSNRMAGAVVGQLYGSIDNCHVKNATIIAVPNAVGDSFDNGDKVGGIVGWLGDNGNNRTLTNCTATNVELGAYRDVGGIAGYVASSTTVKDNAVDGITITVDQSTHYYGDKDVNAGYIYGRANGTIITENNTSADSKVDSTYSKNGLTLKADGEGDVKLYLVPATYTADTVTVPEGVTTIGGSSFSYNNNVKTVIFSSTVRTVRTNAFKGNTSVEKVVLNEGLEDLTTVERAFNQAKGLKEVVFPSTLKTIGKQAFALTAMEELTLPANVEFLGEGAFRDMPNLTTVTIEGNPQIGNFAFRTCASLKNVYLLGDDVTFAGTSQAFSLADTGNANGITIYVMNQTVADRVRAAQGSAYGYTIVVMSQVTNEAELQAALAAGKNVILAGDLKDVPVTTTAPYGNKLGVAQNGGIFDGNGNVLDFDAPTGDNYGIMTSGGTIKNVTVGGAFRGIVVMSPSEDVIIDNVVIVDEDVCYAINTAEGNGLHNVIVSNSTLGGWTSIGSTVKSVSFTNVKFVQGTYYTNVYGRLVKPYVNATFENCDFSSKYYIDLSALGAGQKVVLKNCTVNGVALTAENWTSLVAPEATCGDGQISIELKDGSFLTADNLADYVIIE